MIIETKPDEFSDAELFTKDALAVAALESPVFESGLDAAGAFQERGLCGLEELSRAREQSPSL